MAHFLLHFGTPPSVATSLLRSTQGSMLMLGCLSPDWDEWFILCWSLVWCVVCALSMGVCMLVSLVAFARAVGRVLVCPSSIRSVGLCYLVGLSVGLYMGFGVWFDYLLPGMRAWFIILVCLLASSVFCIGLMPLFLCL